MLEGGLTLGVVKPGEDVLEDVHLATLAPRPHSATEVLDGPQDEHFHGRPAPQPIPRCGPPVCPSVVLRKSLMGCCS